MPHPRKGKFTPDHPEKYAGDPNHIIYRSGLELRCMRWFDGSKDVLRWSSEEVAIPYVNPIDGDVHRYFVDFVIKARQPDGSTKVIAVEVKPETQTMAPKKRKTKTKLYESELRTWAVNNAKWSAATSFCDKHGWEFTILTDRHILGESLYKPYKSYRRYR